MSDDPSGRRTDTVVRVTVPRNRQAVENVAGAVADDAGLEIASVRSVVQAVKDLSAPPRRFVLLAELRDHGAETQITLRAAVGSFVGDEDQPLPAHLVRRLAGVPADVADSLGGRRRPRWAKLGGVCSRISLPRSR